MELIETEKKIIIIAGPNGAGKTTFAVEFLPHEAACPNFVNADLIAAGLAPFAAEDVAFRAGRLMISEIRHHVSTGESFAFETTLSGRHYAQLIPKWQAAGYKVKLFFLQLSTPELAIARVRQRVKEKGGIIYQSQLFGGAFRLAFIILKNIYKPLVDEWMLYNNSSSEPILVSEGVNL